MAVSKVTITDMLEVIKKYVPGAYERLNLARELCERTPSTASTTATLLALYVATKEEFDQATYRVYLCKADGEGEVLRDRWGTPAYEHLLGGYTTLEGAQDAVRIKGWTGPLVIVVASGNLLLEC